MKPFDSKKNFVNHLRDFDQFVWILAVTDIKELTNLFPNLKSIYNLLMLINDMGVNTPNSSFISAINKTHAEQYKYHLLLAYIEHRIHYGSLGDEEIKLTDEICKNFATRYDQEFSKWAAGQKLLGVYDFITNYIYLLKQNKDSNYV